MRAFVLTDKSLERYAGRFVWLSIDIDNPRNAEFLKAHSIKAVPAFLILNPGSEAVALRWPGSLSVAQLRKILDDGEVAVAGRARGADAEMSRADALYGSQKFSEAAQVYKRALQIAPERWKGRTRAMEAYLNSLQGAEDYLGCAWYAQETYPRLGNSVTALYLLHSGYYCASRIGNERAERATMLEALEGPTLASLRDGSNGLTADDRSSMYLEIADNRQKAKDEEGRQKILRELAEYLEREAAVAQTPEQRAVFDAHRVLAYRQLGESEKAIPMLQASERDFPGEYSTPARLARIYSELGRFDEAIAASDRALIRAQGPARVAYLQARADILKAKATADARKALQEALSYAESLPEGQRHAETIDSLRKKLAEMK